MLNLEKLRTFLDVADALSFSEAAQRLNLSQPTISKQIRGLENDLGVTLFERTGNGSKLTNVGKKLVPMAQKLVRQAMEVQSMMVSLDHQVTGPINIACSTTAGRYILPILACRFQRHHPGVQIQILTCTAEHVALYLLDGEADFGIVSREICSSHSVECQPFFDDLITLIVPPGHRWLTQPFIEPEDLVGEPLILREETSGTRQALLAQLAKHDIALDDLNILLVIGNAEAIIETVAAGYGISFVSRKAAARSIRQGQVKAVPVNDIEVVRKLNMVRRQLKTPNRAQDAFWSFVHDPANEDLLQFAG